jgi:hypothetical protein
MRPALSLYAAPRAPAREPGAISRVSVHALRAVLREEGAEVDTKQRERVRVGTRRSGRRSRRFLWIASGVAVLAIGATLIAADGAPPSRNLGAGLVPEDVPRLDAQPSSVPTAPPALAGGVTPPHGVEAVSVARRAEIAAEEQRLAGLREQRAVLERELVVMRQEVEQRRRDLGQKVQPGSGSAGGGNLATGVPVPIQPASGPGVLTLPPGMDPATAAGRGPKVFVHHRASSGSAASQAEELVQNLRGAGFDPQPPRAVPFVPSTPVVRYFHEEDQAAAARLAGRLGRGWAIQDFRAFVPQPPPQTLEVWMPGS